jgi:hypothetical protein
MMAMFSKIVECKIIAACCFARDCIPTNAVLMASIGSKKGRQNRKRA